jgi:hypothetical protein
MNRTLHTNHGHTNHGHTNHGHTDYDEHSNAFYADYPLPPEKHSHAFARGLGWMSIGLGAIELWKNQQLSESLGTGGQGRIFQIYGLREIATGVGLLTAKDPTPWVWARVAGDLLDMATLAPDLGPGNSQRKVAGAATAFVAGATLIDLFCAVSETRQSRREKEMLLPADYHPEGYHSGEYYPEAYH